MIEEAGRRGGRSRDETRRDETRILPILDIFYCTPPSRFADVLVDDIFFYDANR